MSSLDTAQVIEAMDLPGYGLHQLKGKRKGSWSIILNGYWCLTFEFIEGDGYIISDEDYH